MQQIKIWDLPSLTYQDEFLVRNLPGDDQIGGEKPDKGFVSYIKEHDGGLVPVFIQGKENDWKVLHGGEIVRAVRAAELDTLAVLIIPPGAQVDPEIFLAYDRHGRMSLQEKVTEIMRLMSAEDLEPKEIAKRVGLPVAEVKHCLRLGTGNAQIVRAWVAGEVTTAVFKQVVKRPPAEQAILADRLAETGELPSGCVKELRTELARVTAHTMVPMWHHPDFGNRAMVLNVLPIGDGVSVEVAQGQETRKFIIPVERLLQLEGEIAANEEGEPTHPNSNGRTKKTRRRAVHPQ
jgi:hypothetical protein